MSELEQDAIAVVGMSCRFPGARSVSQFWENLREGKESVRFFRDEELDPRWKSLVDLADPNVVRAAATLEDIASFDRGLFGLTEQEARTTDPQHRLFLECAWEALEDAGWGDVSQFEGLISVYAGSWMSSYASRLRGLVNGQRGEFGAWSGNGVDFLPTVTSYRLHLNGESFAVQSACSTSMVAIHLACESLLSGRSDMVLAGGASLDPLQNVGYHYETGGLLSPDGHTRAFDALGKGTIRGHGIGVVALRRLSDALADGDPIHAVVRATAATNDGHRKAGFVVPSIDGMADAAASALAIADIDPASIDFVEMHGGGTVYGDAIEFEAIRRAYAEAGPGRRGVGSVKSNFGDLIQAAGVAGFIKTVLAVKHGVIPPSLNYETPNPEMNLADGSQYVVDAPTPWTRDVRRAGISSAGVGGTNVHAIIESAPTRTASAPAPSLITLSAQSSTALRAMQRNLAAWIRDTPNPSLPDVARTLARGRKPFEHRFAWAGDDAKDLLAALGGASTTATQDVSGATVRVGDDATRFQAAAEAFIGGARLDWTDSTAIGEQCMSLPTYAFDRQTYWVEQQGTYEGPAPAFACWAGNPLA